MSRQPAGAKKENDSGSGIGTKLLLAGGAAAIGFLASELWTGYKEFQQQQEQSYTASSSQPHFPSGPSPSSSSWGEEKSSPRKKNRDKTGDVNVPDQMKCIICMANSREIVLLPCNHVCLCEDCVEKINRKCPVCRQFVQDCKTVYLP